MSDTRRNVTGEVLNAASMIISNNNQTNTPTIITVGNTHFQLELIELVK
ncbi:hypothetical protein [Xenorhabdus anantnagensis]|uniref:Uncharacterized protein n=1 Tax=Xenorhabdus anantnagensis TaxID=3025875 RepID=A0ABT5LXL6_9GAMM|nr:hypothetical protein [Xenorhabdus anantnagensis]MDC9599050.1 hypothetical protein [Xenorhabdus anantnagensis]